MPLACPSPWQPLGGLSMSSLWGEQGWFSSFHRPELKEAQACLAGPVCPASSLGHLNAVRSPLIWPRAIQVVFCLLLESHPRRWRETLLPQPSTPPSTPLSTCPHKIWAECGQSGHTSDHALLLLFAFSFPILRGQTWMWLPSSQPARLPIG